jgi:hypothetical protein
LQNFRKIFSEGINADDDFSIIGKGQWVNASNVRTFTTDSGATGRIEAVGGMGLIFNTLPTGNNKCIGGVSDETRKRILFCNYNDAGSNGIYCYDKVAGVTYTVLLEADIQGGFNFSKYFRISSNIKVVGNLLIFTDNNNEPRCFNIEAGIKTYQSGYSTDEAPYALPMKYTTLTLIKRPGIYRLSIVKQTDSGYVNNFNQNNSYQFTYQYRYRDAQVSTLAAFAQIAPANYAAETSNNIAVTLPFSETIDDDIFAIDICVRYGNVGGVGIVKTWDKDLDAAAIEAHNSGTTALSFNFYDDINPTFLDDVSAITSFDDVALRMNTLEFAKNRVFGGNNLYGYTTPTLSSLSATVGTFDTGSAGTFTSQWKYMQLSYTHPGGGTIIGSVRYYYAYYSGGSPNTTYLFDPYAFNPTPPTSVDANTATQAFNVESSLAAWLLATALPPSGYVWRPPTFPSSTGLTTNLVISGGVGGIQFFKSNSTYKVTIAFYDRYRRKCGVVKKPISLSIPARTYNQTVFSSIINWTLSNTDAIDEIPDWAFYYQIHVSKNNTESFFVQINSINNKYVTKAIDGTYTYTAGPWVANTYYAVAFDLTELIAAGLGYTYTKGDLLVLYKTDGTYVVLPVLTTDGFNVLCKPTDIGDLTGTVPNLIEIYTPNKPSAVETFYETGDVYAVLNPTTTSRSYSAISGQINGDCYTIERENNVPVLYFCETMSPNDSVWTIWNTDIGWPNAIDNIGQKLLTNDVSFSDTIEEGTLVNGLSKHQPLNSSTLDLENGTIQKLQLTNKVQQDGTVMLSICEEETVSMYLGEQELMDTNGSAYVAQSTNVIGTTRALRGSLGTRNPESVFEYNGQLYWWNTRNACAVQYSDNGLFPVSENKFIRPAKLFSDKFNSLSVAEIEALGSDPYIIGGFDPYHKEILFTIPSTEATPPKGYLPDYSDPSIVYPYDIYDGIGKTLVYKHDDKVWLGSMSFQSEFFVKMDHDLYAFKNGALYIMNQPNLCNFFGVQNTAKIMYVTNPGVIQTFVSIGLESNKAPCFVHLRTEDPYTQSTDMNIYPFSSKQGVLENIIMRDRLSPNWTADYDAIQLYGDRLLGKALLTMLEYEFVIDNSPLQLRAANTGFVINTGTLINKQ